MPETLVVESPYYTSTQALDEPQLRNSINALQINGNTEIAQGTIFAQQLVVGLQGWIHNIVWTATDYNTASWGSGTLKLADGNTFSISAGNTGNISATTYIYFDKDVSQTVLQTTTSYLNALGNNKILLAIVSPATDTAASCLITPLQAEGTTIDGSKIVTGRIESNDGKTYFDLDLKRLMVNDGSSDRGVFGYLSGQF